ncbi:uncharacterized protein ARMOST_17476 [Armillaria ostoyae]|uniref:Uncharacterized protein n=1 Tax=Armillaria ostoyae TaxID=47428 RepID=A0A284RZ42_ARMOS|nr:uncharacterized protein ARMOST_17476 [Armillaria ostoyae]
MPLSLFLFSDIRETRHMSTVQSKLPRVVVGERFFVAWSCKEEQVGGDVDHLNHEKYEKRGGTAGIMLATAPRKHGLLKLFLPPAV